VLGIVPALSAIVFFIVALWMLATMVVAVRQALDYKSTGRAIGVCLLGWLVQLAVYVLLGRLIPA
jgi:Zn-dependent protease